MARGDKPVDPNFGVRPPDAPDHTLPTPPDKPGHGLLDPPHKPGHELPDAPDKPGHELPTPPAKPDHELPEAKREPKLTPTEQQRAALHTNINRILTQYGGQESNIPMTNEYWGMVNEYRRLTLQPAPQSKV